MANSDADKVTQLRELLPATSAGIYLDTATRGPIPAETAAAMREAEDWELRVGRVWDGRDEDVRQRHEEARAVVAALISADPDRITLAPSLETAALIVGETRATKPEAIERFVHPWTGELRRVDPASYAVVDVSMAVGAIPVAVEDIGAEAVIFAADKWLLGPEGVTVAWTRGGTPRLPGLALARTALIGFARTVGWLEMYVGLEWMFDRTEALARRLHASLSATDGADVLTPVDRAAAIVTFKLANWPASAAVEELSRRVHALVRETPEGDAVRASVAWFNTEEELDRFAQGVAELAAHTPETLPRRPTLVMPGDA